jgi:Ca2+/H+ antiporter
MKENSSTLSLIITTLCVVFSGSSYLFQTLNTADAGNMISSVLFIASIILLVVAWIIHIYKWFKKDK